MPSKEFPTYVRVLVVIVVIIICFFAIKNDKRKAKDLKKRGRYTIGKTNGWVKNHRSSDYDIDYTYSFKRNIYREFIPVHSLSGIQTKDQNYIVIFDPEHPRNSKLLLEMKVKEGYVDNFNDTGWISIPDFVILYPKDSL